MKRKIIEKKIHSISEHYSRECQTAKTKEELKELIVELDAAIKINGQIVLPDNTWSEIADVIIMCSQLAMQHGKTDKVRQEIEYKVNRQIGRINMKDEEGKKGIIVMDIPEKCNKCRFWFGKATAPVEYRCMAAQKRLEKIDSKPNWCPIRELPKQMEICGKYPQPGKPVASYRIGWNDCINQIGRMNS